MKPGMAPRGMILVCDDEAPIRQVIAHKLRASGFQVREARDGQEGLDALRAPNAEPPILIITDFQMPAVSGLELCRQARAEARTAATPALMLTARGYILTKEELAQTNIREVISKPFGLRLLLERVLAIVGEAGRAAGQAA
jgi:DNA-binding response OmpR family regulator